MTNAASVAIVSEAAWFNLATSEIIATIKMLIAIMIPVGMENFLMFFTWMKGGVDYE